MIATARVVADVVLYRLRRLEMANLAASLGLIVVFRLRPADAAIRLAAAAGLNVLAYLTNDYLDAAQDLATGRAPEKTAFLIQHRSSAVRAGLLLLAALMATATLHDPSMLVGIVGGAGLCLWYSVSLKRIPGVDVVAMALWGALMSAVAVPHDGRAGWLLLVELGLFSAAFELVQVLRDRPDDAAHGIRTTAVALGEERTLGLLRLALFLCAAWAGVALEWRAAPLLLAALIVPYSPDDPGRYWTRLRFVLGAGFIALLVSVGFRGALGGVWVDVPLP